MLSTFIAVLFSDRGLSDVSVDVAKTTLDEILEVEAKLRIVVATNMKREIAFFML